MLSTLTAPERAFGRRQPFDRSATHAYDQGICQPDVGRRCRQTGHLSSPNDRIDHHAGTSPSRRGELARSRSSVDSPPPSSTVCLMPTTSGKRPTACSWTGIGAVPSIYQ